MMSAQPYPPLLQLPFRIGATSYIIEADLVANATYLADKVQDMQLVLFDLPGGPSNLPSPNEIAALNAIAADSGLTYTVHLIEDLRLRDDGAFEHSSLHKAQEVIALTQPLNPWAYVLHLDGHAVQAATTTAATLASWRDGAMAALNHVAAMVDDPVRLAVENLEGYPPDLVTPVVDHLPVSRCVDIGHLWRDGHDPLPWLVQALPHTRVVHLHGVRHQSVQRTGVGQRGQQRPEDHQSLHWVGWDEVDAVVHQLIAASYRGVLTLEIFGEDDFTRSYTALMASLQRYMCKRI